MTETSNLSIKNQFKHMAPLSPQLSQDDLVRGLKVLDNKLLTPSESTELISPISPNVQELDVTNEKKEETVLVDDEFQEENDVAMLLYFEFMDLIYWEIPGRTGILLAGILGSLVLTRYYSLLYVIAGSLTILTGFNLIFVNAYNLIRTVWTGLPTDLLTHPYHLHIDNNRQELISRDHLEYYIHKTVDLAEIVIHATAKIVYVEDTKTTGLACLLSGFIYFATSLVDTRIFFGVFIFGLFTLPCLYEEHQETIDEQCTTLLENSRMLFEKYSAAVQKNSNTIYTQSIAMVQQKMRQNKSATTKEE